MGQKWYVGLARNSYRTTVDLEYRPKTNKDFWRSLKGLQSGPLKIDVIDGEPVFIIQCGAEWNGPTGWFDWPSLMFASLVHDLLVEEWKKKTGKLPELQSKRARKASNRVWREIAKEDGSNGFAIFSYKAIKLFTRAMFI